MGGGLAEGGGGRRRPDRLGWGDVDGGAGDDYLIAGKDDFLGALHGGDGNDIADFAEKLAGESSAFVARLETGQAGFVSVTGASWYFLAATQLQGIEGVVGSDYADTILGDMQANDLDGGAFGADSLAGAAGGDTLRAGNGADTLDGGDGGVPGGFLRPARRPRGSRHRLRRLCRGRHRGPAGYGRRRHAARRCAAGNLLDGGLGGRSAPAAAAPTRWSGAASATRWRRRRQRLAQPPRDDFVLGGP